LRVATDSSSSGRDPQMRWSARDADRVVHCPASFPSSVRDGTWWPCLRDDERPRYIHPCGSGFGTHVSRESAIPARGTAPQSALGQRAVPVLIHNRCTRRRQTCRRASTYSGQPDGDGDIHKVIHIPTAPNIHSPVGTGKSHRSRPPRASPARPGSHPGDSTCRRKPLRRQSHAIQIGLGRLDPSRCPRKGVPWV
jgi:hypothetical protein